MEPSPIHSVDAHVDDGLTPRPPSPYAGPALDGQAAVTTLAPIAAVDSTKERKKLCPTPLAWRQVVESLRDEGTSWEVRRDRHVVRGKTWGAGLPLYFLGGFGGTPELFALSVWLLRQQFQCVVFDFETYDASRLGKVQKSVGDLTDDLFAIADRNGDSTFALYAASFGSAVALTAMLEQPERIDRAVIQGGFSHLRLTSFERLLIVLSRLVRGRLARVPFRESIQAQSHRPWFPLFDLSRWQFFLHDTGLVPVSAIASRVQMLRSYDLRHRLSEIQQPVLLIQTEGEGRVLAQSREVLQRGLPRAQTECLHACGLLPYLTHPHRLVKLIRPFLLGNEETDSS